MQAATHHRVRIGVSGWRYPEWRGTFYPDGLRQADELAYAATHFDSIELNGSFYSLQTPSAYRTWESSTPSGIVFAVKGSRYITHMKRLKNVETALANFVASGLLALGDKLGPILWQLPPSLAFDAPQVSSFFRLLPRTTGEAARLARRHDERVAGRCLLRATCAAPLRHAIEVRHPSFNCAAFVEVAREQDVAIVVADTAGRFPLIEQETSDFVYVRLHGEKDLYVSGYDSAAIARWSTRVERWSRTRDVYVYFDNTAKVKAPTDAIALRARLDRASAGKAANANARRMGPTPRARARA